MRKKILLFSALLTASFLTAEAGGLLTNTNQHIRFNRMFALEPLASTECIATLLVWLSYQTDYTCQSTTKVLSKHAQYGVAWT